MRVAFPWLSRPGRNVTSWLLATVLLVACAAPPPRPKLIPPGDYAYLRDYLSWRIPRDMRAHKVAGLSIALVDDQRVIWSAGFGDADVAAGVRATPQTVYRVASISKLVTATAVMQRVDQGAIVLDRPLKTYLPDFALRTHYSSAPPITLRNLLSHHAGLPSFRYKEFWDAVPLSRLVTELKDEYAAYPPDYVYCYSNLDMDLLGRVLEVQGGRDFVDYMDSALLRPLGMEHASFALRPAMRALMSKGYRDGVLYAEPAQGRDLPAGGLHASVADLGHFMRMLLAGGQWHGQRILSEHSVAEMFRPQNDAVPLDMDFRVGLAWQLGNARLDYAGKVVSHSGSTIVFRSRLILLPEQKLGVVVLSNSSTASPVVGDAAVDALRLALEIKSGLKPPQVVTNRPPPADAMTPDRPAHFAGDYATKIGLARIRDAGGRLSVRVQDRTLRLVPEGRGLRLQYRLFGLWPVDLGHLGRVLISRATVAGHELLVATENAAAGQVGEKIIPQPIPAAWLQRLGDYTVPAQTARDMRIDRVRLYTQDGFLMFRYRLPDVSTMELNLPLGAVSDSAAVILGLGSELGDTLQAQTVGGETQLIFSGDVLRRSAGT